jgi:hypothetical protein
VEEQHEGIVRSTATWGAVTWNCADGTEHDSAVKAREHAREIITRRASSYKMQRASWHMK